MVHLRLQLLLCFGICLLGWDSVWSRSLPLTPTPIVFIPGKAGNQLEAKVDKAWSFYNHCPVKKDWHRLWMDVWDLFPDKIDCWVENMQLYFNVTSKMSQNAPGVDVRIPGWGTSEIVEYLDPSWSAWLFGNIGSYMKPFVSETTDWGYVKDPNFRSAPYDFRLAPSSQSAYFRDLAELIEETYELNGELPVLLTAHSMGGRMARYFLTRQAADWKDKYIRGFLAVNTPWKGTVRLTHGLVSGFNWGVDAVDPMDIRGLSRTHEAAAYLLPEEGGWKEDEAIIITPERNYTIADYDQLFEDSLWQKGKHLLRYVREGDSSFEHPGVRTFCFYGGGIPTAEQLVYENEAGFPDEQPHVVYGDGDGTVNIPSLQYCNQWLDDPLYGNITHVKHITGTDHITLFVDSTFLNWLYAYLYDTLSTYRV